MGVDLNFRRASGKEYTILLSTRFPQSVSLRSTKHRLEIVDLSCREQRPTASPRPDYNLRDIFCLQGLDQIIHRSQVGICRVLFEFALSKKWGLETVKTPCGQ